MPKTESTCGINVGLKDFTIFSDGTTYKNPKFLRTLEKI
jgi:putative transposase